MKINNLLDSLNEAQRDAVSCEADQLLVLAGAGSGKTRVLVHRIAWLMSQKSLDPYQILAVTFTNKAAHEMRGRIETVCQKTMHNMWVGTFHSISHRFLRLHWQAAQLPEHFQILDSDDQLRLVKRILQSLNLSEERWPARQAQWFINQQKDEGLRAATLLERAGYNRHQKTWAEIYQAYETMCERSGFVDFGELLLRTYELLGRDQSLLSHYQNRFQHVLVDEFQDTNTIQYAWLQRLAGKDTDITLVGDDDQSIYGWRGAKIENIQQFQKDYPKGVVIRLEQNYRSTEAILSAANAVIAHNQGRLGKKLWTQENEGEPIELFAGYNEIDEARFIAERITQYVGDRKGSYQNCAVLYRSNAQSRVLEEAMLRENIPYRIYGGLRFFDRAEIKNALGYLRLVFNRNDDAAFERIVAVPPRGIGEKTLSAVREKSRNQGISMWESSLELVQSGGLPGRALNAVNQFLKLIESFVSLSKDQTLSHLMEEMIQGSGLKALYEKEKGEKAQARLENLRELVAAAREFETLEPDQEHSGTIVAAFLDHAALESGELQAGAEQDSVQMMTLHSAKGLEFPLVFISGMEEGLFPHQMSMEDPQKIEEERRLAYVGMTRAMSNLVLTYAEVRRLYGNEKRCFKSRFLREIPDEFLTEVRFGNSSYTNSYSEPKTSSSFEPDLEDAPYQLGQRVHHAKFGEGTVLSYEGTGEMAKAQINFDQHGIKWLLLSFATLEPA